MSCTTTLPRGNLNNFSMRTNRILLFIVPLALLMHCKGEDDRVALINATFMFINDTAFEVTVAGGCGFGDLSNPNFFESDFIKIAPSDTIIVTQKDDHYSIPPDPDVNNFSLFPSSCFAIYGDSVKCDFGAFNGIRNRDNYESKQEVSENNFEFIYRFTELTMNEAGNCNY